jgi:hypothetical protein
MYRLVSLPYRRSIVYEYGTVVDSANYGSLLETANASFVAIWSYVPYSLTNDAL